MNQCNYPYDKEKIENYINNYIEIKELSISDGYFILKLSEEIDININDFDAVIDLIIKDNCGTLTDIVDSSELYMGLYLMNKINNSEINSHIFSVEQLTNRIENATTDSEVYYLVLASDLLDIDFDNDFIIDSVSRFEAENGGYSISSSNEIINLLSTYRMISLYNQMGIPLNDMQIESTQDYLYLVRGDKGGYFLCEQKFDDYLLNYDQNITIESCYYGYWLYDFIKNLEGDLDES